MVENTFLDRLKVEKEDLLDKVTKLSMFLAKQKEVQTLSDSNLLLLQQQLVHMNDYLNVLIIRIELIEK